MPDTGAPWNIPYVEAADLVSDWPADSLALANAIDAGLDAAGNAGIGSNAAQTVKDDIFTTTSTSLVDVTGLSVSITPTSATSKVLVIATVSHGVNASMGTVNGWTVARGATNLLVSASAGSRQPVPTWTFNAGSFSNESLIVETYCYLDSPATTSSTDYKVRALCRSGTFTLNRATADANSSVYAAGVSTITAIEVAA